MEQATDPLMPVFPINVASELVDLPPRVLRYYEKAGLIRPARVNGKRRFSNLDILFIKNIKCLIEATGVTLAGLRLLYMIGPCWEIRYCSNEKCPAYKNYTRKCWQIVKDFETCNPRICKSCPKYLVSSKNKAKTPFAVKDLGPKSFDKSRS
jgi:MerR family transcriptional regulator/heat shock protein HspR